MKDIWQYCSISHRIIKYCLIFPNIVQYCPIFLNIVQYCPVLFNIAQLTLSAHSDQLWQCKEHSDIVLYCQIYPNTITYSLSFVSIDQYCSVAPCFDIFSLKLNLSHFKFVLDAAQNQLYASMQVCRYASMKVCKYESIQICKYASMQVCKYASMQVCKYARMKVCKYERACKYAWKICYWYYLCNSNLVWDLNYTCLSCDVVSIGLNNINFHLISLHTKKSP